MLFTKRIEALVFAYEDDGFNRPQDLKFLTDAYPKSLQMIGYHCGEGHFAYQKDASSRKTKPALRIILPIEKKTFSEEN